MYKLNEKGLVQLLIPLILALGIGAGVWLITSGPLNIFPKALSNPISGPVSPSPTPSSNNIFGKALRMNFPATNFPTGMITVPIKLTASRNLVLSLWVKPRAESLNNSNPSVILMKEFSNGANGYMLSTVNKKLEFTLAQKISIDSKPSNVILTSHNELTPDKWHHVTVRIYPESRIMYLTVDGDGTSLSPIGKMYDYDDRLLSIGCGKAINSSVCLSPFYGEIDELLIEEFGGDTQPSTEPYKANNHTIALYHFDGDLKDSSQNRYDGSVNGCVEFINSTVLNSTLSEDKNTFCSTTPSSTPTPTPTNKPINSSLLPSSSSYRRVFVTSASYTGELGGLAGADQKCQIRAQASNLGGTWKAWLSDSNNSPATRFFKSTTPYKLLNGVTIANDWNDLTDGTLQNSIIVDESGEALASSTDIYKSVWTNTALDGTLFTGTDITSTSRDYPLHCNNWIDRNYEDFGKVGFYDRSDFLWTGQYIDTSARCSLSFRLYCFEQEPTGTGPTETPIPTSEPSVSPTVVPTSTPNQGGGSSGGDSGGGGGGGGGSGGNATPQPVARRIGQYRVTEDPADFRDLTWGWKSYTQGVEVSYEFKNTTTKAKFIFVQFRDTQGQIVKLNGQDYLTSSAITLVEPTPVPTSVPTQTPGKAPSQDTNQPTGPAPLAEDGPNCPIADPSNYDIGTLYTMCSVDQLARFDLKWLVDFPNDVLIDIGRRKGDLGGFLANFSGERLIGGKNNTVDYTGAGFGLDILNELPAWRKQQLPQYIQDQLN